MQHPLPAKFGTSLAGRGGRSVGIIRLRNIIHGVSFEFLSPVCDLSPPLCGGGVEQSPLAVA
jgi:hypothetical protein